MESWSYARGFPGVFYQSSEELLQTTESIPHPHKESSEKKGIHTFPKAVFFILGNEFCERFSFYGMRTILTIYLTQRLHYSEDKSTMFFHLFSMLSYLTPILGAVIADTWLGRYRTIFYVSILYVIGNVVIALGAVPNTLNIMRAVSMFGLVLIGIGTGGIKPCVSAFGGDQFHGDQAEQREHFFSIFYFIINCGSLFSTLLTPILRADVQCFHEDTCYPLAFGVPGALMIIAAVLFIAGKSMYIIKEPEGNVIPSFLGCIFMSLIADIKALLRILVLCIPIPLFWALFDQTFGIIIKPDQLQAANPILIIIFIPLFQYAVYPLLGKCNLLTKPLQRMTVGGFLVAGAFVMAGFLEIGVERTLPVLPEPGYSELIIVNLSPCSVNITGPHHYLLKTNETVTFKELPLNHKDSWTFSNAGGETGCVSFSETKEIVNSEPIQSAFLITENGKFHIQTGKDKKIKEETAMANVRVFFSIEKLPKNTKFKFEGRRTYDLLPEKAAADSTFGRTDYTTFEPGKYKFYLYDETSGEANLFGETRFHSGGTYIVGIVKSTTYSNVLVTTTVEPNSFHILMQVPQYIVLTAAEIMFSITGLEFSYSQAPLSMKSVVQAAWLLTVTFGNLIVTLVAEAEFFRKQSNEFFMFAIVMTLDMLVFTIIAYFYKYVNVQTESEAEFRKGGPTIVEDSVEEIGNDK